MTSSAYLANPPQVSVPGAARTSAALSNLKMSYNSVPALPADSTLFLKERTTMEKCLCHQFDLSFFTANAMNRGSAWLRSSTI